MTKATNLFEQLTAVEFQVVGQMVGGDGPAFRNYMREVPPLVGSFTIGDASRAYLAHRLASLQALNATPT